MNNAKSHIKDIRQNLSISNFSLRERLERSISILTTELYSSLGRALLELLQNADDSNFSECYDKDSIPTVYILLRWDCLIVHINELGMTPENIESICDIGNSSKKNSSVRFYTGEKGIGYRSVFQISNNPSIYSGYYSISFSNEPDKDVGLGYIVPKWEDHNKVPEVVSVIFKNISRYGVPWSKEKEDNITNLEREETKNSNIDKKRLGWKFKYKEQEIVCENDKKREVFNGDLYQKYNGTLHYLPFTNNDTKSKFPSILSAIHDIFVPDILLFLRRILNIVIDVEPRNYTHYMNYSQISEFPLLRRHLSSHILNKEFKESNISHDSESLDFNRKEIDSELHSFMVSVISASLPPHISDYRFVHIQMRQFDEDDLNQDKEYKLREHVTSSFFMILSFKISIPQRFSENYILRGRQERFFTRWSIAFPIFSCTYTEEYLKNDLESSSHKKVDNLDLVNRQSESDLESSSISFLGYGFNSWYYLKNQILKYSGEMSCSLGSAGLPKSKYKQGKIFCTLPLKTSFVFPFHVDIQDLLLTANREELLMNNQWNDWLISLIFENQIPDILTSLVNKQFNSNIIINSLCIYQSFDKFVRNFLDFLLLKDNIGTCEKDKCNNNNNPVSSKESINKLYSYEITILNLADIIKYTWFPTRCEESDEFNNKLQTLCINSLLVMPFLVSIDLTYFSPSDLMLPLTPPYICKILKDHNSNYSKNIEMGTGSLSSEFTENLSLPSVSTLFYCKLCKLHLEFLKYFNNTIKSVLHPQISIFRTCVNNPLINLKPVISLFPTISKIFDSYGIEKINFATLMNRVNTRIHNFINVLPDALLVILYIYISQLTRNNEDQYILNKILKLPIIPLEDGSRIPGLITNSKELNDNRDRVSNNKLNVSSLHLSVSKYSSQANKSNINSPYSMYPIFQPHICIPNMEFQAYWEQYEFERFSEIINKLGIIKFVNKEVCQSAPEDVFDFMINILGIEHIDLPHFFRWVAVSTNKYLELGWENALDSQLHSILLMITPLIVEDIPWTELTEDRMLMKLPVVVQTYSPSFLKSIFYDMYPPKRYANEKELALSDEWAKCSIPFPTCVCNFKKYEVNNKVEIFHSEYETDKRYIPPVTVAIRMTEVSRSITMLMTLYSNWERSKKIKPPVKYNPSFSKTTNSQSQQNSTLKNTFKFEYKGLTIIPPLWPPLVEWVFPKVSDRFHFVELSSNYMVYDPSSNKYSKEIGGSLFRGFINRFFNLLEQWYMGCNFDRLPPKTDATPLSWMKSNNQNDQKGCSLCNHLLNIMRAGALIQIANEYSRRSYTSEFLTEILPNMPWIPSPFNTKRHNIYSATSKNIVSCCSRCILCSPSSLYSPKLEKQLNGLVPYVSETVFLALPVNLRNAYKFAVPSEHRETYSTRSLTDRTIEDLGSELQLIGQTLENIGVTTQLSTYSLINILRRISKYNETEREVESEIVLDYVSISEDSIEYAAKVASKGFGIDIQSLIISDWWKSLNRLWNNKESISRDINKDNNEESIIDVICNLYHQIGIQPDFDISNDMKRPFFRESLIYLPLMESSINKWVHLDFDKMIWSDPYEFFHGHFIIVSRLIRKDKIKHVRTFFLSLISEEPLAQHYALLWQQECPNMVKNNNKNLLGKLKAFLTVAVKKLSILISDKNIRSYHWWTEFCKNTKILTRDSLKFVDSNKCFIADVQIGNNLGSFNIPIALTPTIEVEKFLKDILNVKYLSQAYNIYCKIGKPVSDIKDIYGDHMEYLQIPKADTSLRKLELNKNTTNVEDELHLPTIKFANKVLDNNNLDVNSTFNHSHNINNENKYWLTVEFWGTFILLLQSRALDIYLAVVDILCENNTNEHFDRTDFCPYSISEFELESQYTSLQSYKRSSKLESLKNQDNIQVIAEWLMIFMNTKEIFVDSIMFEFHNKDNETSLETSNKQIIPIGALFYELPMKKVSALFINSNASNTDQLYDICKIMTDCLLPNVNFNNIIQINIHELLILTNDQRCMILNKYIDIQGFTDNLDISKKGDLNYLIYQQILNVGWKFMYIVKHCQCKQHNSKFSSSKPNLNIIKTDKCINDHDLNIHYATDQNKYRNHIEQMNPIGAVTSTTKFDTKNTTNNIDNVTTVNSDNNINKNYKYSIDLFGMNTLDDPTQSSIINSSLSNLHPDYSLPNLASTGLDHLIKEYVNQNPLILDTNQYLLSEEEMTFKTGYWGEQVSFDLILPNVISRKLPIISLCSSKTDIYISLDNINFYLRSSHDTAETLDGNNLYLNNLNFSEMDINSNLHNSTNNKNIKCCERIFKVSESTVIALQWLNAYEESYLPCDFLLFKRQISPITNICLESELIAIVEVKTTRLPIWHFNVSGSELNTAKHLREKYKLLLIKDAGTSQPQWILLSDVPSFLFKSCYMLNGTFQFNDNNSNINLSGILDTISDL
ncbi:uncharacterized protein CMU_025550 [Cryptosporidium muris RN66]|uniref:Uncharacterized protein n=1 Tax=Cryptosporidium muris (strain RN66) TaxID=441375 RepID=B6AAZ6_CRYMR|nr:uncharacterized protein CMU_025550 [Cryptosporidium muris RN66]EEA05548.1 hypothetical protein, conserved [Cryptosporidium muris RN66]|eukprot:XP_002139897.1 hypothetical protein [Cryptosporidium muris RN66]